MDQHICPTCHQPIQDSMYFCPNCGAKLKDDSQLTTIPAQIKVYLISIFLPPFGFLPGVKYLMKQDEKAKKIGMIVIVLTLLSTIINGYLLISFVHGAMDQAQKQLQMYNGFY